MSAPVTTSTILEPRRFSIRLPQALWVGLAAVGLVTVAVGLQIGVPIYGKQMAIWEIERLGGRAHTQKSGPEWLRRWAGDERMAPFDEVVVVNLEGTQFADAHAPKLEYLTRLRVLNLASTQITDDGLAHIGRLPRLRVLDLRVTRVTDVGLAHLRRLPRLERIGLMYTRVSGAGITELEKAVSGLQVGRGPPYDQIR